MKWHKYPNEEPETHSGSYLILTHFNEIAEAEYRQDGWYQYRWSSYISGDAVKAWCSFKEIERPEMANK